MTLMSMDSVISRDLPLGCLTMTSDVELGSDDVEGCSTLMEKERGCKAKAFREELLRLTTPELVAVFERSLNESISEQEGLLPSEVGLTVRIMG